MKFVIYKSLLAIILSTGLGYMAFAETGTTNKVHSDPYVAPAEQGSANTGKICSDPRGACSKNSYAGRINNKTAAIPRSGGTGANPTGPGSSEKGTK